MLGVIEGESHNGIVSALSVDSINLLLRVQISLLLFLFYPPPGLALTSDIIRLQMLVVVKRESMVFEPKGTVEIRKVFIPHSCQYMTTSSRSEV